MNTELKKHVLVTEDEAAHQALAARLAKQLAKPGTGGFVIFLQGDLGTGKTSFARGFIHGAGYQGTVRSPTYTLVEPYPMPSGNTCYHFDLYRLADPGELEFTGARDHFNERDICLVEWPEKAASELPLPDWLCQLRYLQQGRQINISAYTEKGMNIMLQLFPDV